MRISRARIDGDRAIVTLVEVLPGDVEPPALESGDASCILSPASLARLKGIKVWQVQGITPFIWDGREQQKVQVRLLVAFDKSS